MAGSITRSTTDAVRQLTDDSDTPLPTPHELTESSMCDRSTPDRVFISSNYLPTYSRVWTSLAQLVLLDTQQSK